MEIASTAILTMPRDLSTDDHPSTDEVLECLSRSGYLLESRLVQLLTDEGFFVEANQSVQDTRTGKSREIDLIAESHRYTPEHGDCKVKTTFIVEALNNRLPFVLLTPWSWTPLSASEYRLKFSVTPYPGRCLAKLDLDKEKSTFADDIFSQFCGLSRKSGGGPLMASHPDDVYGSLLKAAEYIELRISEWSATEKPDDKYWRIFFWQPVLVLGGQLLTVRLSPEGKPLIEEAPAARLVFNWHCDGRPTTTVFNVVTEAHFKELFQRHVCEDFVLEQKLHAIRAEFFSGRGS